MKRRDCSSNRLSDRIIYLISVFSINDIGVENRIGGRNIFESLFKEYHPRRRLCRCKRDLHVVAVVDIRLDALGHHA